MKIHPDSHLDHGLTAAQVAHIFERFANREAFFIETFELPPWLGDAPCSLYGPIVGDLPVPECDVEYVLRGPQRVWPSRTIMVDHRYPRTSRLITVVAGPHDGIPCVLFTAYGGPLAPQEPGDPKCKDIEASKAFWAEHALITRPMLKLG